MKHRLAINSIACTGHGICAEIFPEMIALDEWGYPILADDPVPRDLAPLAKRAVRMCPTLALRLEAVSADRRTPTGGSREPAAAGARSGSPPSGERRSSSSGGRNSADSSGRYKSGGSAQGKGSW